MLISSVDGETCATCATRAVMKTALLSSGLHKETVSGAARSDPGYIDAGTGRAVVVPAQSALDYVALDSGETRFSSIYLRTAS
jgi:hypothetical protein